MMKLVENEVIPTYGTNGKKFKLQLSFKEYYGHNHPNKTEIVDATWDSLNECFYESTTKEQIMDEDIVAWDLE